MTLSAHYFSLANLDPFQAPHVRARNFIMGRDMAYPLACVCSEAVLASLIWTLCSVEA